MDRNYLTWRLSPAPDALRWGNSAAGFPLAKRRYYRFVMLCRKTLP